MPRIDLIPECLYEPLTPYHYLYDNQPLRNILARIGMVNDAVDLDHIAIMGAAGSAGTLTNRLSVSMEDNGELKATSIDNAEHYIGMHTDDTDQSAFLTEDDTFVRMTDRERDKLLLIDDEANLLNITFEAPTPSAIPVPFTNGTLTLANSLSTSWRYQSGKMYLDLAFPIESAHQHYYDIIPDSDDFLIFSVPLEYIEGSLRVHINGVRLTETNEIYHPTATQEWLLNKYTIDPLDATKFTLDNAITSDDVIKIDYDRDFT
jgi:hypothetical protein